MSGEPNDFDCLARNVYYEAKSESRKGQLAVALVTLNRVDHPNYPKSVCSVVYQKNQFSWTKLKQKSIDWSSPQGRQAKEVAIEAFLNRNILGNFRATHFHNTSVHPKWAKNMVLVSKINGHIFYR